MLTRCLKTQPRRLLYAALALCFAGSGCSKGAAPATSGQPQQMAARSSSDHPLTRDQIHHLFDLQSHPDAIILHPVDPAALTETQRKFGVAPTPDPRVEYQPGIIVMEHGDQAIRAFGKDGNAVNFFLSFVTDVRIERVGSLAEADPIRTFQGFSSYPDGFSSK